MIDHEASVFQAAQARHKARKAHLEPFIIRPKAPVPAFMSYKCKCGSNVRDYHSYQNAQYYIFTCYDCGRIRRFANV